MKIAHWVFKKQAGLDNMASGLSRAENQIGLESILVNSQELEEWKSAEDADVHVLHSHVPSHLAKHGHAKILFIPHGTPEHIFTTTLDMDKNNDEQNKVPYLYLTLHWLQKADAVATFWKRHITLWDKFTRRPLYLVPMGVERDFWTKVNTEGKKYPGKPSIFSSENPHPIKWALDMILAMPFIIDEVPDVCYHLSYSPLAHDKVWRPLYLSNGAFMNTLMKNEFYQHEELRYIFSACDFYLSLVRYGDHNRIALEAASTGIPVISYEGNEYADYWVSEGNQMRLASQIVKILKGEVEPRKKLEVFDTHRMSLAFRMIYESMLSGRTVNVPEKVENHTPEVEGLQDMGSSEHLSHGEDRPHGVDRGLLGDREQREGGRLDEDRGSSVHPGGGDDREECVHRAEDLLQQRQTASVAENAVDGNGRV